MAISLEKVVSNGITLYYWRIVSLQIVVNEQCIIEVAGYPSQEKRAEEQAALAEARETGHYPEVNVYIDTMYINAEYDPEMSIAKAYQVLKSMEEFEGGEDLIEAWSSGSSYHIEDLVIFEDKTYRCIQSHVAQDGWEPDATPSLWSEVATEGQVLDWKQPIGSHDAYDIGDHVMHNGKEWISTISANVFEPGVYGWDEA